MSERRPRQPRSPFSSAEDAQLNQLVQQFGETSWHEIEAQMPGRSARQCRDRWKLYLSPNVSHQPWPPDDEVQLQQLFQQVGPHWTTIARHFPNRTPHNVKSHLKQLQRRLLRTARFGGNPVYPTMEFTIPPSSDNIQYQGSHLAQLTGILNQGVQGGADDKSG
jgi:hypothetical protein